ncbi:MAG: ABC transporter permease [Clostridia bacterium]|nr:ABC transporter permease [Clostridia bacterium]
MKKRYNLAAIVRSIIKGRRKSYFFMMIAIIFSVFFSSSIGLIGFSTYASIRDRIYLKNGYQDIILNSDENLSVDDLVGQGIFSEYGITETLGYVLSDGKNFDNGFPIAKYDAKALSITNKQLIQGDFPKKTGEIAIERSMLARLRLDTDIGDKITLTLAVPDGEAFLAKTVVKTYTLTGILHDQYIHTAQRYNSTPVYIDIPAAIVSDNEEIEAGGRYVVKYHGIYLDDKLSRKKMFDMFVNRDSPTYIKYAGNPNDLYMIMSNDFEYGLQDSGLSNLLLSSIIIAILIITLLFVAGFGIASTFSANIEERKRQIGMIRAVGATKKQIRKLLFHEIFLLSIISIPIGLLLSMITIKLGSAYFGDLFSFVINIPILLVTLVFSLMCIVISVIIPLRKVSIILPMQAIRDSELSLRLKKKHIVSKKMFHAEKHIAKRKTILYKNKLITISIFIALTVIILLLSVGYGPFIIKDFAYDYRHDFGINTDLTSFSPSTIINYGYRAPGISESDKQEAERIIGNGSVSGNKAVKLNLQCQLDEFIMLALGRNHAIQSPDSPDHDLYLEYKQLFGFANDFITVDCIAVDEDIIEGLRPFVYDGQINMDKIASGEEVIMFVPRKYGIKNHGDGGWSTGPVRDDMHYDEIYENKIFHAGDVIDISLLYTNESGTMYADKIDEVIFDSVDRVDNKVRIGALVQREASCYFPFDYYRHLGTLVTSYYGFSKLGYSSPYKSLYATLDYIPDTTQKEYIENELEKIAAYTGNTRFVSYISITETAKRQLSNFISVVVTIFILFASLSVGMINIALSAQIRSSKQMIGTIRAVGATQEIIQKTFTYQLINMIKNGVIIGFFISLALYIWMVLADKNVIHNLAILPAILSLVGYVMILFLFCSFNISKKIKRYLKRSIVENIREL